MKKSLLEAASSSEFLEKIAVGLMGTEALYRLVTDEVKTALASARIKALVSDIVSETVKEELSRVVIVIEDNDILVIPSSGLHDAEFDRLSSMIPQGRRVGLVAADDIKILKLT